jgi:hypothetical protein
MGRIERVPRDAHAVTVSFAPTPGELWRTRWFVDSRSPLRLAIGYILIPVVIALVVTLSAGADLAFGVVLSLVYIAIAVAITAIAYLVRYHARSGYRRWRTLTFDAEGIDIATQQTKDLNWESFGLAYERPDGLVLMTGKRSRFLWIPYRAFGSSEDLDYAKDLVEFKLEPAPVPMTHHRLAQ